MCAVTNFRTRRLPSVKRTPSRFYFVKSYPFLNPPSALRPIPENLPDRERLTHGNIFLNVIRIIESYFEFSPPLITLIPLSTLLKNPEKGVDKWLKRCGKSV